MTARNRAADAPKISARKSARLHAREAQRKRDVQRRYVQLGVFGAVLVVGLALVGWFFVAKAQALPGKQMPNQGQAHIDKGQTHVAYNSKPPTSGPHWNIAGEAPVNWGIYTDPIPDEAQIHNIEHGGIMIQYNCSDCPDLVAQLTDFYNRYSRDHKLALFPNSTKMVVAPYPDMPTRIALTAWTRIDQFDQYDEDRITKFVDQWRDKGPEIAP